MIRPISIRAVLNGYVVDVGCQTVVFNTIEALTRALGHYLLSPEDTEKEFAQHPNARHTLQGPPTAAAPEPFVSAQIAAQQGQALREYAATSPAASSDATYIGRR